MCSYVNWYSSMKKNRDTYSDNFWHRRLTLKVRILRFLTTFMQVYARPKLFLLGWLLALSIKEEPDKCVKVCDISMFTGVMVEDNNIYWTIYSILMLSIFAVMKIMATTKRIIEKIKEYQNYQIINIQLNPG